MLSATKEFSSVMALSTGMHDICQAVLLTVNRVARESVMLQAIFLITAGVIILNLCFEASKIILHASHRSLWALMSPEFVRKFLRGLVVLILGVGAYNVLVFDPTLGTTAEEQKVAMPLTWLPAKAVTVASAPFMPFTTSPDDAKEVIANIDAAYASTATTEEEEQAQVDEAVGAVQSVGTLGPGVLMYAVGRSVQGAAEKLDAWTFVKSMQNEAIVKLGVAAANQVLTEVAATGVPPLSAPVDSEDSVEDKVASIVTQVVNFMGIAATVGVNTMISIALTAAYFCMDLVIVRVLWMNALYIAVAYRLALVMLPLAILLAYWPATTGITVNIVRLVFVGAISLKMMAILTTSLLNPAFIRNAVSSQFVVKDDQVSERVKEHVRSIYNKMLMEARATGASNIDPKLFRAKVEAEYRGTQVDSFSLSDTGMMTIVLPLMALMCVGFIVTLIGKVSHIVQDAIGGTMTYHRGG